jgi:hypothetical protein
MRPDDSDKACKRPHIMFDGELLDDYLYAVWGRLESQRAGYPRFTEADVRHKLWIVRERRRCSGNCALLARAMRKFGWQSMTAKKAERRIKTLKERGILDPLSRFRVDGRPISH